MPFITYQQHSFRRQSRLLIDTAKSIIAEYQAEGYDLTLRQLFYQFVARGHIENSEKEYNKLGVLISRARLAGLINWETIVDRTRTVEQNIHFKDPADILATAAETYKLDTRSDQNTYIEVWIEKEALLGVIEPVCRELDVTYLACRGYYSQSAMWEAAQRINAKQEEGKKPVILHLGDHDPSGIDMTRDIEARLRMFEIHHLDEPAYDGMVVERIALNMDQVEQYSPPPNPAKLTDTRATEYISEYGRESWELDALDPKIIVKLIEQAVGIYTDEKKRQELLSLQESHKDRLDYIADHWTEVGSSAGDV
jgi:hypothetical protein